MSQKLAILDLDGVLLDSRELHYEALNEAIRKHGPKYSVIKPEEHLSTYDGLPTRRKLELLSEKKDLPRKLHDAIYQEKQKITLEKLNNLGRDYKLQQYFRRLRSEGIKIAVCSNSIRDTVVTVLCKLGLMELVDYFVIKPTAKSHLHPGIYKRIETGKTSAVDAMILFVEPSNYRKFIDLEKLGTDVFHKRFQPAFEDELIKALATAKQ